MPSRDNAICMGCIIFFAILCPSLPPVAPLTLADPPPDCGLQLYLSLHGNQLVSNKEGMCWGEHGMLYAANASLNTPTET